MSAYFVVKLQITNPAAMQPCRAAVSATVEQYGGRYLVLAGATELIEGGPEPKRVVILEFADTAAFKRWYKIPENPPRGSTTRPHAPSSSRASASGSNLTLGTRAGRFRAYRVLMVYWEASGVTRRTLREMMGDGRRAEPGMHRLLVY